MSNWRDRPKFAKHRNRRERGAGFSENFSRNHDEGVFDEPGGSGGWNRGEGSRRDSQQSFRSKGQTEMRGRGKARHPPHLKGKAIGMFYAKLSKETAKCPKKLDEGIEVTLDSARENQIKRLLASIPAQNVGKSQGMAHVASGEEQVCGVIPKQEELEDTKYRFQPGCSSAFSASNDSIQPHFKADMMQKDRKNYDHISDSAFKRNFLRSINETIESKIDRLLKGQTAIKQNPSIDEDLKKKLLLKKSACRKYSNMYEFRKKLPSFKMQQQILDKINGSQVVVISGETGCGKTTQVPQFILDDHIMNERGSLCRIVCTQPRRISAISVAERVAAERDEELGSISVGYQIRLEKKVAPKQGSILFCTTGILLQWMQSDPSLSETSHVVLDEIHERDTLSDFAMTLLRDILPKRPDLRLILMSATLNSDHFSRYFSSCPAINIPGFTFPVEELYLEDVLEITRFEFPPPAKKHNGNGWKNIKEFEEFIEPHVRNLKRSKKYSHHTLQALRNPLSEDINIDLIADLIKYICTSKPDGAILVFLPGWEQISNVSRCLTYNKFYSNSKHLIIPLHSMMPTVTQRCVFDRPPPGVRKIILATNIAETSITIDDVVYVVDCGKIKMKNYDVAQNIQTLQPEWVSLANSRQRRGRAGRVQPGVCYHLYSRAREMILSTYTLPEMLRTRLEEVILTAKILQLGRIRDFLCRVMDPPNPLAIDTSLELLTLMNALDNDENLTPLGYHLAKLPVDPHTGKMLLMGALFSCVNPVFSVAASLGFKDAFMIPLGKEKEVDLRKVELSDGSKSDHLLLADALMKWENLENRGGGSSFCHYYFLSQNTLRMLRDLKKQFTEMLHEMQFLDSKNPGAHSSNINSSNRSLVKAIVCAGLYPNVALFKSNKKRAGRGFMKLFTPQDGTVYLHPKSVNDKVSSFESPYFVYHLKLKSKAIMLHDTTMVYPLPLLFFGENIRFFFENGSEKVSVGKHLFFKCKESTARTVMELREHLDSLLEYRACHPGVIDWQNTREPRTALLRAIAELITYEDSGLSYQIGSEDDDDYDSYDEVKIKNEMSLDDDVVIENVYEEMIG